MKDNADEPLDGAGNFIFTIINPNMKQPLEYYFFSERD